MRLSRSRRGKISIATARFSGIVAAGEEGFDVAGRLTQALPVLDQRDPDEPFAIFAKADARRYRHIGLFEQQLGEREAADRRGRRAGSAPRRTSSRRVSALPSRLGAARR